LAGNRNRAKKNKAKEAKRLENEQKRRATAKKKLRSSEARAAAREREAPVVELLKLAGIVTETAQSVTHDQLKQFIDYLKEELPQRGFQELSDALVPKRASKSTMLTFFLEENSNISGALTCRRRRRARRR